MELLGKHIGLFLPKKAREAERSADDILAEIYQRLETINSHSKYEQPL
tara:strand:- start:8 stop:151 length:144 start_codon:yes stop_codon:yes gene_type:complete